MLESHRRVCFLPRRATICIVVALGVTAQRAHADDTHYRGTPIGSHPIALGGAFTGVADDASTAYHNPAGLVREQSFGLAGSLSIFAFEKAELVNGYQEPGAIDNVTSTRTRDIPLFASAVIKLGPKDRSGQKRYALAYSVARPILSSLDASVQVPDGDMTDTYTINANDRANYFGLSFAARLDPRNFVGISWYLSMRRLDHREVGIGSDGGTVENGEVIGAAVAANQARIGLRAWHFVLRLGWLREVRPSLTLGLTLQLPGIPLRQRASVVSQLAVGRGESQPSSFFFLDQTLRANAPIPPEIEFGLSYRPSRKIMLAVDASIHGPTRNLNRVDLPAGAPPAALGIYFDQSTRRRPIGNVAAAMDVRLPRNLMVEVGAFTDLSAAPSIPSNPTRYHIAQVNRYGATASLAFVVGGVSLSVGSTFIFGRGDGTAALLDPESQLIGYEPTRALSRIAYVHITGATEAAETAAKVTGNRLFQDISDDLERDREEDDDEGASR